VFPRKVVFKVQTLPMTCTSRALSMWLIAKLHSQIVRVDPRGSWQELIMVTDLHKASKMNLALRYLDKCTCFHCNAPIIMFIGVSTLQTFTTSF